MYGQIVISLPAACGVVAATCTKIALKNQTTRPHRHAAIASWWTARNPIPPTIEIALTPGKRSADERLKEHEEHNGKGVLHQLYHARHYLRGGSAKQRGATEAISSEPGSCGRSSPAAAEKPSVPAPVQQQETGQSVRAAIVNSQHLDNMLGVVTVVQQMVANSMVLCQRRTK
jgi:hypothetical protein